MESALGQGIDAQLGHRHHPERCVWTLSQMTSFQRSSGPQSPSIRKKTLDWQIWYIFVLLLSHHHILQGRNRMKSMRILATRRTLILHGAAFHSVWRQQQAPAIKRTTYCMYNGNVSYWVDGASIHVPHHVWIHSHPSTNFPYTFVLCVHENSVRVEHWQHQTIVWSFYILFRAVACVTNQNVSKDGPAKKKLQEKRISMTVFWCRVPHASLQPQHFCITTLQMTWFIPVQVIFDHSPIHIQFVCIREHVPHFGITISTFHLQNHCTHP